MSLPEDPIIPTNPPAHEPSPAIPPAARARRRRAARAAMFPTDAEGQIALVASLSRRAYPTLELFVFSLVSGAIIGCGFLLDSQAVLLLGVLVTPIMTPWVGFLLSIFTGSTRFLFETLRALIVSAAIVFLGGALIGFAARMFLPATFDNAFIHARLWYHELIVLSIGAITLVASFARSEDKPFLPSILIAYAFYLPINASGFGLGSGVEGIWIQGLFVFIVHFGLASLLGLITLFALRLKPTRAGSIASGLTILALVVILIWIMFPQAVSGVLYQPPTETPTPALVIIPNELPSATPVLPPTDAPTEIPTLSPTQPPTFTRTPTAINTSTFMPSATSTSPTTTNTKTSATASFTPSATATTGKTPNASPAATFTASPVVTPSLTSTPQPILGRINAGESGGANLRQTPNGKYILTLLNDTVVEISPEKRNVSGVEWLRVFATVRDQRLEGWILASVVTYENVTPSP